MILNLAFLAREDGDRSLWEMEDAELVEAARKHLADWRGCHGEVDVEETVHPASRTATA